MKTLLKYHGPTIAWALFVLLLCSIKLGTVTESPLFFPGFDKLVHCGFFFVFVVFYSNGLIRQHNYIRVLYTKALMVFVLAVLYGFIIEELQKYIFIWRDFEWNDVFADTVGASMGIFSVLIITAALKHEKK